MKKAFFFFVIFCVFNSHAQVGIGTDNPEVSSILDLNPSGNDKGLLIPRLSQGERDAINSPANGLLIFQTDNTEGFYFYSSTNSSWIKLSLVPEVNTNTQIITSNTLSITTNNGLIESNALSITANINNIAANTASITANMTSGTVSITSNTAAIDANTLIINSNTVSITDNRSNISSNLSTIQANTASITNSVPYLGATNSIDIGTNSLTIGGNLIGGNTANSKLSGFVSNVVSYSSNHTLSLTDNGKILKFTNPAGVTLTLPTSDIPEGFNCMILQNNTGQITFSGTFFNRNSFTKTSGRYSIVTILYIGGNFIISGEMSN